MCQADGTPDHLEEEGQRDGDEAAAPGHEAVGQAQAALEIVTQDHQGGLEGEGAATAKEDPIGEITHLQRPGMKQVGVRMRGKGEEESSLTGLQWSRSHTAQVLHTQSDLEEIIPSPKQG